METSGDYKIRGYKKGDEEGITALFKVVFGKVMTPDQWKWKYLFKGERGYSKIAEDLSGEIIAHAGAIPLRGVFKNKPVQFFQIADVMVHPKARGYLGKKNVFNSLVKTLFEDIAREFPEVFCYGFPGTRPFSLGRRVGVYDKIEQAIDCVKYIKTSFLNPYRIRTISWNDNRLDALWLTYSKNFSLSVIRDQFYLQWRYVSNPFFSYQLLGIFFLGKLSGWVVIRDLGDEVIVIDLLTERKRCGNVLKALENYLISRGKKTISLWLPEYLRKNINGYTKKKTDVTVTNMVWKLPIQTSVVMESLYYTKGDIDIF